MKEPPRRDRHPEDIKSDTIIQANHRASSPELPFTDSCSLCGAWCGSLGLEPTPELYVQHLVEVFREVKRVLRSDGTLWLNMGDSYARQSGPDSSTHPNTGQARVVEGNGLDTNSNNPPLGLKSKDLIGIPWRVAFALQADDWYLRSDIIWSKPNPMPESVTDRPTKAHEYVFLLSKSPKYYFDQDAVREPQSENTHSKGPEPRTTSCFTEKSIRVDGREAHKDWNYLTRETWLPNGRNIRSVWTIPTQPFKGAHFATFPERLVEPMVKAGCPANGIVLDPFIGSGTVGLVALKLNRNFIGIELNPDYVKMAQKRVAPYLNKLDNYNGGA